MLCKYRLVVKVMLDKYQPLFILTKDMLSVFLFKKKKNLTGFLSTLFYIDFVLLLIMTVGCFP